MNAARLEQLRQELTTRYQLRQQVCRLGRHTVQITTVDDPDLLLDRLIELAPDHPDVVDERLPYWAWLWPAACELGGLILTRKLLEPGASTLELGCGLGLISVAAMLAGARVTATDYQPDALLFTELNCLANDLPSPETVLLDWRQPTLSQRFDYILAADVAYEERFFQPLLRCFKNLLADPGKVLLAEPNRAIARPFFTALRDDGWTVTQLQATDRAGCYELTFSA